MQDIGRIAAANPVVTGSLVFAALAVIGPLRTIRWTMRGIAMASLASKLAEGAASAKLSATDAYATGADGFTGGGIDIE